MATAKAFVRHVEGFTLIGKAASDHWVSIESASKSIPTTSANNPVHLLLIACAGCVMTDVVDILTKGRHDFSGSEMDIEAILSATPPKIIRRLDYNLRVNGENLHEETVRRAIKLSLTKYCCASLSLDRRTTFFARIALNGTSGEPWEFLRNFELYEEQSGK